MFSVRSLAQCNHKMNISVTQKPKSVNWLHIGLIIMFMSKYNQFRSKGPSIGNDIWGYGVSNGHVTDDVTWPPKVLWGSTVGYPSDSLASCSVYRCVTSACSIAFLAHNSLARYNAIASLSVRPSYGWISQKRLKLGLWKFHHTVSK